MDNQGVEFAKRNSVPIELVFGTPDSAEVLYSAIARRLSELGWELDDVGRYWRR
jgi:hypothetical protein